MGNTNSGHGGKNLNSHLATAEKTGALAFDDKKLDEFPSALGKVSGILRNLDLSKNRISVLPPHIGAFTQLKTLRLTDNRLTGLPNEIGQCIKLEGLYLSGNQIRTIPGTVQQLKNLKDIDLSHNKLQCFPEGLTRLKKLDFVNLSSNSISNIDHDLSDLSATELNLNQNQLSTIPESLSACPRLKTLRLEENCIQLEDIPASILKDSSVSNLAVAGNLFSEKRLAEIEGHDAYMERFTAVRRKLD